MEKEHKEITEGAEQKKDNLIEREMPDKKKEYVIFGIILLLFLGLLIFLLITRVNNKDNYVQIEDVTEIEEVNFDNLLLSYRMEIHDHRYESWERHYLCIFNTGSIYCFDYPENLLVDSYYDETNWKSAENVIYMGRLSDEETERLNQYVGNFDMDDRFIIESYEHPTWDEFNDRIEPPQGRYTGMCLVRIYWHGESEIKFWNIANCTMVYLGFNRYEINNANFWIREENAIAATELIESSEIYDRWIAMCLNDLKNIKRILN